MPAKLLTPEQAIAYQRRGCEMMGALGTMRLVAAQLAILATDTHTARAMRAIPGLSTEHALPLRLTGALHHLHLTGDAPDLGRVYSGELTDQGEIDSMVCELVARFDERVATWLAGPPQTNEAGRSGCIMAALLWLARYLGPRFELNEIGASAGVNTMMERFYFDLGGIKVGPADSPMRIVPEWRGPPPPAASVEITAIHGSDIAPLDLSDGDAALRLKAYVWPDVPDRMQRIDAAIAFASERRPDLVRADAGEWVPQMLARRQEADVTRVLFHTIMWQYMPVATRESITRAMEQAGARATRERPLAWVRLEHDDPMHKPEVTVRRWSGGKASGDGETVQIAAAHPHGAFIEWFGD